jgi:hypothetical protein
VISDAVRRKTSQLTVRAMPLSGASARRQGRGRTAALRDPLHLRSRGRRRPRRLRGGRRLPFRAGQRRCARRVSVDVSCATARGIGRAASGQHAPMPARSSPTCRPPRQPSWQAKGPSPVRRDRPRVVVEEIGHRTARPTASPRVDQAPTASTGAGRISTGGSAPSATTGRSSAREAIRDPDPWIEDALGHPSRGPRRSPSPLVWGATNRSRPSPAREQSGRRSARPSNRLCTRPPPRRGPSGTWPSGTRRLKHTVIRGEHAPALTHPRR